MIQAQVAWVALLPERNSFFKLFEMVARIIMWLYKTSNIDQVRASYKFFLNEIAAHRGLTILSYLRLSR